MFAAAQAAQKTRILEPLHQRLFAAAQAAQKSQREVQVIDKLFAAAQAAQKQKARAQPPGHHVRCRTGSSEIRGRGRRH